MTKGRNIDDGSRKMVQKFKSLSLGTEKEGNGDAGGDTQRKIREAGLPERLRQQVIDLEDSRPRWTQEALTSWGSWL